MYLNAISILWSTVMKQPKLLECSTCTCFWYLMQSKTFIQLTRFISRSFKKLPFVPGIHDPRRGSDSDRKRRSQHLWKELPRWDRFRPEAHRGWYPEHGQQWTRHQRVPVLHHPGPHQLAGREAHHLRAGPVRNEDGQDDWSVRNRYRWQTRGWCKDCAGFRKLRVVAFSVLFCDLSSTWIQ